MKFHSYKEWKELGFIVKKGEHVTKVDDELTYLFSEEQVVPIKALKKKMKMITIRKAKT